MGMNYSPSNQTERFITAGRVAMVAVYLLDIYFNPVESLNHTRMPNCILRSTLNSIQVCADGRI